jgi:hypothetical protein
VGDFDSEHIYVQWGGKLPGGEQWSCGLRLASTTPTQPVDPDVVNGTGLQTSIKNAIVAFHQSDKTNLGTGAKLSFVKTNVIDVTGHYKDPGATNEIVLADLPGAGTSPQVFPNQVALVVTFTTNFNRGPAHSGRIYLPLFNSVLDSSGLVPAANADLVSQAADTLIASLNSTGGQFTPAVFSRKTGAARHHQITGNRVGRVLDTQRRRRRSLPELYV